MEAYKLILFICLCTNSRVLSAPSIPEAESNGLNSAEFFSKRSPRESQSIDGEKNRDLILRLQTLFSLLQLRPSQSLGSVSQGQNVQSQPQGELVIKLPLATPSCYAQHFIQNPELIVLFHRVVEVCGGDPNLLLVGLDQAAQNVNNGGGLLGGLGGLLGGGNGGGLLGGLGGLLGGGQGGLLGGLGGLLGSGSQGGLLGGLGGLLGSGNQGGLLGGLGGLLGGNPSGGLLGGLGGLLGGNRGQYGNGGLLGGLGGLLGGQSGQGGLLPGLGGLLGGQSGQSGLLPGLGGLLGGQSGQSGLLPGLGGLLGGQSGQSGGNGIQNGQSGSYYTGESETYSNEEDCDEENLASDNIGNGLLGGVLGGGSQGGLLGNVLGGGHSGGGLLSGVLGGGGNGGQSSGLLGGVLGGSGGGGLVSGLTGGLTGGLTSGITSGIVNGVAGGVVSSVESTIGNLPVVGNLLRRHANEATSKEIENTATNNEYGTDFTQNSMEMQTTRPKMMNQQHEMSHKVLTNMIQRNEPQQDAMHMMMNQEMSTNQEMKTQDMQQNFDMNGFTDENTLGKLLGLCDANTHVCTLDIDQKTTKPCDCNKYCECLSNFKQFSDKQKPKRKYRRRKYKIVDAPKDLDVETQIQTNTDDLFETAPSQYVKTIDNNNAFRNNGFNTKQQFESNEKQQRQIDEYFY